MRLNTKINPVLPCCSRIRTADTEEIRVNIAWYRSVFEPGARMKASDPPPTDRNYLPAQAGPMKQCYDQRTLMYHSFIEVN